MNFEKRVKRVRPSKTKAESQLALLPTREQKASQAAQIIQLASSGLTLFQTPQGEPYASVELETHNENHAVSSSAFRQFLNFKYFRATKTAPQTSAIHQAISHFGAIARFDSPTESTFIRVGSSGGRNYLDLANDQWDAVEFSKEGWGIMRKPPIRFRRASGMLPLPRPARRGDINDLREFLNLKTDEDWALFVTDLVNALFPEGPYTVLGLHGEAGSAKTTTARVSRKLIDPNISPSRGAPRDIRDLMVASSNSWMLSLDNLSFLPVWLSDCLCRLSTGGGFSTRTLYTNYDEVIFDGQRPIILNGIEELATRTDLLERSLLLELPVIRRVRSEQEFWRKFEVAYPQLLGSLLDLAVEVLQNLPKLKNLSEQPRMADFARVGTAAESALGLPRGAFMEAYNRNRQNATAVAREASPIANQISQLGRRGWQGTASELLQRLKAMVDNETQSRRSWPKNPRVLSGMLRRLATALRTDGVEIGFDRDETRNRNRTISIRRLRPQGKK